MYRGDSTEHHSKSSIKSPQPKRVMAVSTKNAFFIFLSFSIVSTLIVYQKFILLSRKIGSFLTCRGRFSGSTYFLEGGLLPRPPPLGLPVRDGQLPPLFCLDISVSFFVRCDIALYLFSNKKVECWFWLLLYLLLNCLYSIIPPI